MTRLLRGGGSGESVRAFWVSLVVVGVVFSGHGFAEDEGEKGLVDMWSGEDMRKMAGYGEERLSTVLVAGSVICEACNLHGHGDLQLHAWPVSGAKVGVNCHNTGKKSIPSDWIHGVTDEFGDFIIDIPSHLHAIPSFHKTCSVKILRLPKRSRCRPVHIAKQKRVQLSSFGSGIRTYTSGLLRLQHRASEHLQACVNKGSDDQQTSW